MLRNQKNTPAEIGKLLRKIKKIIWKSRRKKYNGKLGKILIKKRIPKAKSLFFCFLWLKTEKNVHF